MAETASYYRYWGKAKPEAGNGPAYHLLPYHCLDVAAVGSLWLAPDTAVCKQLAMRLQVEREWLQRWFTFCLVLHDLGKFARAFQGLRTDLSDGLVKSNPRMTYSERHDSLGFALWRDVLQEKLAQHLQPVQATWINKIDPWLEVVTGHHGMPPKLDSFRLGNFFEADDEQAAFVFVQHLLDCFLADFDFQPLADKNLYKRLKPLSWQFAGIAVLADWLGSNQEHFTYCAKPMPLTEYWQNFALPKAKQVLAGLPKPPVAGKFEAVQTLFPFIQQPTPLQRYAAEEPLTDQPQFFILEDVTGAGKTEAALILTQRLIAKGLADGLYIGLPTMATANAMYQRLGKVYRSFYETGEQPSLLLAHGARELSQAFRDSVLLAEQANLDTDYQNGRLEEDQELSATAYCNAWLADSRKKALLADVGVGTLDQALLAVLPARHQSLRLLGLGRKVLLVDEVHAYDSYMRELLSALLEAHARQGGSAILLSATLPQTMRESLTAAFHHGLGLEAPNLAHPAAYPLATHTPAPKAGIPAKTEPSPAGRGQGEGIKINALPYSDPHAPTFPHQRNGRLQQLPATMETPIDTRAEVERTVHVQRLDSEEQIIAKIRHRAEQGQCVCWIRNTVKSARQAYQTLLNRGVPAERLNLFHSRFAMIDRQTIENRTLQTFGELSGHDNRKGQILIATQVVEQSLDLDFDVLISDLAPIDLLIQRAGRLRRHVRDALGDRLREPGAEDGRDAPVFYLYAPTPSDDANAAWLKPDHAGTQAVYPHVGQLWLSARLLADKGGFAMPEDARELIEGVYADEAQARIPLALQEASFDAEGKTMVQRSMADLNVLKLDKGYTRKSGDWDEETKIPTRLSEEESVSVALALLVDGELKPYADVERFAWALSTIKLPEREWKKVSRQIPDELKQQIETLKSEQKALRWLEVLPLLHGQNLYSATDGFSADALAE
ncbi:CRISPR-associated helicase/endonuclease Cas3 [Methylomonas koyamae]|uniref:CRISPR-associated helicase/endonuclease Cas3 n=1 Tax=Methylomonas koyamae TaxID=702114 RepID=A0A177MZI9_9GAMM|nr:CRISPR-associated helicase Cas3' [Methylomonas koyamae]OAI11015.1 CRISPR-associated helicase/endonuclease Cas3 [Methylomonas koyamae]